MFFWARRFHLLLAGLKIGECQRLYDFFTVFVAFPLTCGRQIQGTDSFQSNALLLVPHVASLTATLRATIAGLGAKEAEAMKVCGPSLQRPPAIPSCERYPRPILHAASKHPSNCLQWRS